MTSLAGNLPAASDLSMSAARGNCIWAPGCDRRRVELPESSSWLLLPWMTALGSAGGALWALGPALNALPGLSTKPLKTLLLNPGRAADRQLLHIRLRLSAESGLPAQSPAFVAAARLPSWRHAHSPWFPVWPRVSHDLWGGDDPHALGPSRCGRSGATQRRVPPRHSRFADHDRRDDAGGRNGGRGR